MLPWVRRELVAERYRNGRVFIAGDAAHVMSPTGGFGMNTGIGDAVDLAWKLAAVLEGWGGDALARLLRAERQPVGARNVDRSQRQSAPHALGRPHPDLLDATPQGAATRETSRRASSAETMRREWFTLGIHLGYRYEGSPICWPDGTAAPPDDPHELRADGAARAPRAARLARRRPLDARSVRPRLRAARLRRRRGRGRAAR